MAKGVISMIFGVVLLPKYIICLMFYSYKRDAIIDKPSSNYFLPRVRPILCDQPIHTS